MSKVGHLFAVAIFVLILKTCYSAQAVGAITIETVPIGNPGNAKNPNSDYGSVDYTYSIGKYDVTVGQYTEFLNAVAATDTYGLYSQSMATDLNVAGIARNGSSGSYTYSVIGSPNHPITYVSWGDAARFVNWLSNGQPSGGQTLSTTEDGSYRLNGITGDVVLNRVTRKASATWVLPTESEWYKAAYYDPAASHYWGYATGTDSPPASAPPSSAPNMSNYNSSITGYALTGSSTLDPNQNYLTDVGAYTSSASPYGTFDQSGNVEQWTETLFVGALNTYRISSGANWRATDFYLMAGVNAGFIPTTEFNGLGLRVALVPEPGTVVLLAIGGVVALVARRRKFG